MFIKPIGVEAIRVLCVVLNCQPFGCIHDFSGGHREGETPDPIPNSAVKPFVADGTMRKSMEE